MEKPPNPKLSFEKKSGDLDPTLVKQFGSGFLTNKTAFLKKNQKKHENIIYYGGGHLFVSMGSGDPLRPRLLVTLAPVTNTSAT